MTINNVADGSRDRWYAMFENPFDYRSLRTHPEVSDPQTIHHPVLELENVSKALDLGCGQGFTAVYLASTGVEVVAADKDDHAVKITTENVKLRGLGERVEVVKSDLFSNIEDRDFDTIICYPPQPDKPGNAWKETDPGQEFLKGLLNQAGDYLDPSGPRLVQLLFSDPSFAPPSRFWESHGFSMSRCLRIPLILMDTSEQSYFVLVGLHKELLQESFSRPDPT